MGNNAKWESCLTDIQKEWLKAHLHQCFESGLWGQIVIWTQLNIKPNGLKTSPQPRIFDSAAGSKCVNAVIGLLDAVNRFMHPMHEVLLMIFWFEPPWSTFCREVLLGTCVCKDIAWVYKCMYMYVNVNNCWWSTNNMETSPEIAMI